MTKYNFLVSVHISLNQATLVGIDVDKKIFNITFNNVSYLGSLGPDVDGDFNVPSLYNVEIEEKVIKDTGKTKKSYVLLKINEN